MKTLQHKIVHDRLKQAIDRFKQDVEPHKETLKRLKKEGFPPDGQGSFKNRLFEHTSHPSQIYSLPLKQIYLNGLAKLRHGEHETAESVLNKTIHEEYKISQVHVPSNALLDKDQTRHWQQTMLNMANTITDQKAVKAFKWGDYVDEWIKMMPDMDIENALDEAWETIHLSKQMLLHGIKSTHDTWIDFDGAKRPQGIMFSIFARLLYQDMTFAGVNLNQDIFKIDALIHALTELLGDKQETPPFWGLERLMRHLKRLRIDYLNDWMQQKQQVKDKPILWQSERVRFYPRLDHRFVESAQKLHVWRTSGRVGDYPLSADEQLALNSLESILEQVLDLNELSHRYGGKSLVPELMIAEVISPEDVIVVDEKLADLNRQKRRYTTLIKNRSWAYTPRDLAIVPLFEYDDTTNPKHIYSFLNALKKYYAHDDILFSTKAREIFFAGSDLSKNMGQSSALFRVKEAAIAAKAVNPDILIKLGTGEAHLRQMGYLDSQGFLPIYDDGGGERPPRGFNRLKKYHGWVNSFTMQSRANERMLLEIEPSRLKRLVDDLKQMEGVFEPVSDSEREMVLHEHECFIQIMGKKSSPEKPGGYYAYPAVVELLTTTIPAVRDRAVKRDGKTMSPWQRLTLPRNSGINSRAIAASTAAKLVFPLGLLGKGSMLTWAKEKNIDEKTALSYIDPMTILQELKWLSLTIGETRELMQKNGFKHVFSPLYQEYEALNSMRPYLQELLWLELTGNHTGDYKKLTLDLRELLDDEFQFATDKTKLFYDTYQAMTPTMEKVLKWLVAADGLYRVLIKQKDPKKALENLYKGHGGDGGMELANIRNLSDDLAFFVDKKDTDEHWKNLAIAMDEMG